MMTVITRLTLGEGMTTAWDAAMRQRMETAKSAPGWVAGQILKPFAAPQERVIVGVWESHSAWETWHHDPTFQKTREVLAGLGADDGETVWHEAVYDGRR